jgi:hypothetical protein
VSVVAARLHGADPAGNLGQDRLRPLRERGAPHGQHQLVRLRGVDQRRADERHVGRAAHARTIQHRRQPDERGGEGSGDGRDRRDTQAQARRAAAPARVADPDTRVERLGRGVAERRREAAQIGRERPAVGTPLQVRAHHDLLELRQLAVEGERDPLPFSVAGRHAWAPH